MASGAQPAVFLFPTGIDIYSTKVDRGTAISGEGPYTVPTIPPYQFYLNYVPQTGSIAIGGWSEVFVPPAGAGQFQATYSGTNAGLLNFWAGDAGNGIAGISYVAFGDIARAFYFNNLQQSVDTIESFILSGLGITGTYVQTAGDTMSGNLVMAGANIVPSAPSGSSLGSAVVPFLDSHAGSMYSNSFTNEAGTNGLVNGSSGNSTLSAANGLTITAAGLSGTVTGATYLESTAGSITLKAIGGQLEVVAPTSVFYGDANPSADGLYDLGSSGLKWKTIHADNIDAPLFISGVVSTTGSTMIGNLNIAPPFELKTNLIENYDASLVINSTGADLNLNGNNINLTSLNNMALSVPGFNIIDLGGALSVSSALISTSTLIAPTLPGSIDIGTPGLPFSNIYANNFVGLNLSGSFVRLSGDTMTGDLVMGNASGTGTQPTIATENINSLNNQLNINVGELAVSATNNIHFDLGPSGTQVLELGLAQIYFSNDFIPTVDSFYDIGSTANYVNNLYARNIHASGMSGVTINTATLGNVTITGNITMNSGTSILSAVSGTVTIGSSGNPIQTIYANNIVTPLGTGTYLSKFGDTIQGNLLTSASGTNDIGSLAVPFNAIYANNIISTGLDDKYVNTTGDTMTGALFISNINSTGSLTISGINNINMYSNQIVASAEQINLTSTVGPIIVDANTELQQLINGAVKAVISQSGTKLYDSIYPDTSGTHTVGTPSLPFYAIYADNIINTNISGTGLYVLRAGDGMYGNLTMLSGSNIFTSSSGVGTVGSSGVPFQAGYFDNLYLGTGTVNGAFVHLSGDSMYGTLGFNGTNLIQSQGTMTIQAVTGNMTQLAMSPNSSFTVSASSGVTINSTAGDLLLNASSAGINMSGVGITGTATGSSNILFSAPSAKFIASAGGDIVNVESNNLYLAGVSGELLKLSGSQVIISQGGSTNYIATNTNNVFYKNIVPSGSGTLFMGTAALPFSGSYFRTINGVDATFQVYNETPTGLANGINTIFTTAFTPVSNSQKLYRAGLRMTPGGIDYSMVGATATFIIAPASGDNILIDYDRLAY